MFGFSIFQHILFQDASVYWFLLFLLQMLLCWFPRTCYEKCVEFWSETGLRSNYLRLGHSNYKLFRSHSSEWSTLQYKEFDSSTPILARRPEEGLEIRRKRPQIAPNSEKQTTFNSSILAKTPLVKPKPLVIGRNKAETDSSQRFVALNMCSPAQPASCIAVLHMPSLLRKGHFQTMIVTDSTNFRTKNSQLLKVLANLEHQLSSKFE